MITLDTLTTKRGIQLKYEGQLVATVIYDLEGFWWVDDLIEVGDSPRYRHYANFNDVTFMSSESAQYAVLAFENDLQDRAKYD